MVRPDYRTFKSQNELYHYGMPRRSGRYPWGSGDKPYQSVKSALKGKGRSDYFTSERTIPKGTKMFRTVTDPNPNLPNKPTYVTYLEPDRDLYRGGYVRSRDKSEKAYEHQMTLKEDLKIPSRETFKQSINDVIKKNPKLFKESVESYINMVAPPGSMRRFLIEYDDDVAGKQNPKLFDEFVKDASKSWSKKPIEEQWGEIAVSLGTADKLKDAIINDLKKQGYNAMVDEAGVGGSGRTVEGIDPLIIFDPSVLNVNKTRKTGTVTEVNKTDKRGWWEVKSRRSGKEGRW